MFKFSLIICTYMRPKPLLKLLKSVSAQTCYPNEILIIDGSTNNSTKHILDEHKFDNLFYYKVDDYNRGLTKQRNFGVSKVNHTSDIVCFLDDDTELINDYFNKIIMTFQLDTNVVGVGGVAVNENNWFKPNKHIKFNKKKYYKIGDYLVKEGLRNVARNYLGLQSPFLPGLMPNFSHGRTCGYPLNNNLHQVDLLIGMSFCFRKQIFNHIIFSTYFEGYGLYEDADFSLRALAYGKNIINTAAKLYHYHDHSGRPNKFKYGKMVVRNGWYVWRVKYPKPSLKARFKWNATSFLLTLIRFTNIFNTSKKQEAFMESMGRCMGWFSLIFNKPKINR